MGLIKQSSNYRVNRFLVMKTDRIELITQQHILNYIASSGKMTDIQIRDILGDPVPQVDSKCTIQQAIQLMEKEVSFQYQFYNL